MNAGRAPRIACIASSLWHPSSARLLISCRSTVRRSCRDCACDMTCCGARRRMMVCTFAEVSSADTCCHLSPMRSISLIWPGRVLWYVLRENNFCALAGLSGAGSCDFMSPRANATSPGQLKMFFSRGKVLLLLIAPCTRESTSTQVRVAAALKCGLYTSQVVWVMLNICYLYV